MSYQECSAYMKARIFAELLEITDMSKVKLKAGDRFLMGNQIIAQKDLKKVGHEITYYLVTDSDEHGNVSYKPIYDKMEE